MKKINWGIIGLGDIANAHLNCFNKSGNFELKGIASKNLQNLKNFKENLNSKTQFCFNNYEDLISRSEIDIIYIALPNSYHYQWINKCIDLNKSILVEKPITENFFQLENIKKKLIHKNLKISIYEGFMYKHHPQIKKILELVSNDEIGEILKIDSSFGVNLLTKKKFWFFQKKKKIDKDGRLFNKDLGGGSILDLGCYTVSLITMLMETLGYTTFDKYKIFKKNIELGETGVDIDSKIEMKINNKINVTLSSSFKKNIGTSTKIVGSKGIIEIPNLWFGSSDIILKKNKTEHIIKFDIIDDPYFNQINEISNNLLENNINQNLDNMLLNMKIIDQWLN